MELTVVIHQGREDLWSEVPELPGCFATARTLSELQEALVDNIGLYLWDMPAQLSGPLPTVGESKITVTPLPSGEPPA
jgi:predicted RNase H-like HicB family nuclease